MRKAFAFLASSLFNINPSSSEETKTSTQHTLPNKHKESNKLQITTPSNTKYARSLQNKLNNTNETKSNNNETNSLGRRIKRSNSNDLKKLVLKKSTSELKKLEPITELSDSRRKTSIKSTSSIVSSSNHRRKKSPVIKSNDGEGDVENDSENFDHDNEEDDDEVPLGLQVRSRSTSFKRHQPPSSQRNQEFYEEEVRIRNTSDMLLQHNRSMTPDYPSRQRLSQNFPVATTPPLIHNNNHELLKEPRPHYFRERRFSSSASSSSSASIDSSGSRYHRDSNVYHNITSNGSRRNSRYSTYSFISLE